MNEIIQVKMKFLDHGKGLDLPFYATNESAGMDLKAAIDHDMNLAPMERILVSCGFCMALPCGYEAQIRSRSGLSFHHGVVVLNSPGTVDSDYRGEIKVILINLGKESFKISPGMRIAQMVIGKVSRINWTVIEDFDGETDRGEAGFGSTGL